MTTSGAQRADAAIVSPSAPTPPVARERYPVPTDAPVYVSVPAKVHDRKGFSLYALLDVVFIVAALALTFWFAGLLFREGLSWHPVRMLYILLFWGILAYLALPRLHQLFTYLYVPDYFIARTRTGDGLLGDPINLGVDGSEEDIHAAMQRAGWVLADEITLRSTLGIIRSSVTRRSYPQAPVSGLNLFGKRHAFAYQQEVDGNAAQRHHVRFWPVPEGWKLPGGHEVQWIAAGTYDRSVGLSLFTGQVTHKIDADIDLERDYIIDSVRFADPEVGVHVIDEFSTAYHHRNGGGDSVHTDGDLPVLDMTGAAARATEPVALPVVDPSSVRERRLPPLGLLLASIWIGMVLMLVLASSVLVGVLSALLPGALPASLSPEDRQVVAQVPLYGLGALLGLVFLVFTLRRHRWARIGLMLVAGIWAFAELVEATSSLGSLHLSMILSTSLAVLAMLALSSDASRDWVMKGRKDPRIDVGSRGVSVSR